MKRVKQIMLLIIGVIMVMSLSLTGMASDYVCYIGTTGYGSLAEAVGYAQDGDTIWMTANDEESANFTVDKSIKSSWRVILCQMPALSFQVILP